MTFKPSTWRPIAGLLTAANLIAAGFAMGSAEPLHAGVHVALALAFGWWAQRLGRGTGERETLTGGESLERLEAVEDEVSNLRRELGETQERIDFAERLLAQRSESRRVGPDPLGQQP